MSLHDWLASAVDQQIGHEALGVLVRVEESLENVSRPGEDRVIQLSAAIITMKVLHVRPD